MTALHSDAACDAAAFPAYRHWARHQPDALAMVTPAGPISYGDLADRIRAKAGQLRGMGLAAGDRFLHVGEPGTIEWVATLIAALDLRLELIVPDQDWPDDQIPIHTDPLLQVPKANPPTCGATADSGGVWLFTSGTTSTPKPRLRSLSLLQNDVARVLDRIPRQLRERRPAGLCLLPLSHGFGLVNALLLMHTLGGTVLVADPADRTAISRLLERHPVEVFYAWPALLEALADASLWARAATPLQWCVSSSLRLAPEVAERFARASGCPVRQQYGATETGPLCLDSDDPPSTDTACVGRPLPGVEFEVVDADGRPLPDGAVGQLIVRLNHLSLPAHELTPEGYWRTGDEGHRDTRGRIHVHRRLKAFTDERAQQNLRRD